MKKLSEQEEVEVLEDLLKQKQDKILRKYVPSVDDLAYLNEFRKGLYNKEGKSKGGEFAVVASFPEAVHVQMTNLHGPGWVDKPGILQDFLQKNPHYRIGKPVLGLQGGMGEMKIGGTDAKV